MTIPIVFGVWRKQLAAPETSVVCLGSGTCGDGAADGAIVITRADNELDQSVKEFVSSSAVPDAPSITPNRTGCCILIAACNTLSDTSKGLVSNYTLGDANANATRPYDINYGSRTLAAGAGTAEAPAAWSSWTSGSCIAVTLAAAAAGQGDPVGITTGSPDLGELTNQMPARLSIAASIVSAANSAAWSDAPGIGYIEGYFRLPADIPSDVLVCLDEEWLDGLNDPYHVSGGDWMSFVGFMPGGFGLVAVGTAATMAGTPSTERTWQTFDLSTALQTGVWYRARVTSNFITRHFVSLQVEGPGINDTIDLSAYTLDYPNHMPFDERGMAYLVGAMRTTGWITAPGGTPVVEWDDVVGVMGSTTYLSSSFETQGATAIPAQPINNNAPPFPIANYDYDTWYKERDETVMTIVPVADARTGDYIARANADTTLFPGEFPVNAFVVTTLQDETFDGGTLAQETADGGGLSLREALGLANASPGSDRITFAANLSGGTLFLTNGELEITTDGIAINGDIDGDGHADITIDAGGDSRVFIISHGQYAASTISLNGLVIQHGNSGHGAGGTPVMVKTLIGGRGNDTLIGGKGNDSIIGGDGNDVLNGGDGNDTLAGGNGDDTLISGRGDDTLIGGRGNDNYLFGAGFGHDTIADFHDGDHIVFDDDVFANFAALLASNPQQVGSSVVITAGGNTLELQNVSLASLHASDFLFVSST